jgi:beta-glucanase (GH16 family)
MKKQSLTSNEKRCFSLWITLLAIVICVNAQQKTIKPLLPNELVKWQLVWNDEFDYPDSLLDKNWISQNAPSGHILCSRWRENAVVNNGTLKLVNRKESRGGQEWTSGNIWTKEQFQYGYYECRYRYAAAKGTNNSFWLMMKGIQPTEGKFFELDINEGHYPNSVNTNIHNWSDVTEVNGKKSHPSTSKGFKFENADLAKDFHTYGLDWSKEELVFYFDGKEIRRVENQFCYSPAPVWLSLAIIPWAGKITDAIDKTEMEVDYVRIYKRKE